MTTSVGAYVAEVDRLLGAGQHLFTASSGPARLDERTAPSPPGPSRSGGLSTGSHAAGERYETRWSAMSALDGRASAAAADGSAEADRGRAGTRRVRETARGQAAAIAPATGSPAGMRLMVSTMDERLAAMEREVAATKAQNRLLMQRLRQVAMAYRSAASPTSAAMSSVGAALGGGRGRAASQTLGARAPAAMARAAQTAARPPASTGQPSHAARVSAAGIAQGVIPLSEVSFHGRQMWPGGRAAVRSYLDEALDRMGIRDPRARANWIPGMMTIAEHESSLRADAINLTDSNAWGPRQIDGGPLHSTRGLWQVMPDTFARYHQPGTSNSVWDPVASACASMNYQMDRYGVAFDGHNQRALVGQANPDVRRGY